MIKPVCAANFPGTVPEVLIRFVREVFSFFHKQLSQELIFWVVVSQQVSPTRLLRAFIPEFSFCIEFRSFKRFKIGQI
jgi:hypothetical protein